MKPCVCIKMEEMANVCTESEDDGRVSRLICGMYRVPAAHGEHAAEGQMTGTQPPPGSAAVGGGSGRGALQRAAAAALRPTKLQNPGCFEMN